MELYHMLLILAVTIKVTTSTCPPNLIQPHPSSRHIKNRTARCDQPYQKMVSVSYQSLHRTRCWNGMWGLCNKTRISYRSVSKTFYQQISYNMRECADGYKLNSTMCIPCSGNDCPTICLCQNGGICRNNTGICDCTEGFEGPSCDKRCKNSHFGRNCNQTCLCQNDAVCNATDGSCSCKAGYIGKHCSVDCPSGWYGLACASKCGCQNGVCHHVTGICNCKAGYERPVCSRVCRTGTYGQDCGFKCNCQNGVCHHVTGTCNCTEGYEGLTCGKVCRTGTYGQDCGFKCNCQNGVCHHVTGTCNCTEGYEGLTCGKVSQRRDSESVSVTAVAVGSAVGCIVLLVACVVGVIMMRRKNENTKKSLCRRKVSNENKELEDHYKALDNTATHSNSMHYTTLQESENNEAQKDTKFHDHIHDDTYAKDIVTYENVESKRMTSVQHSANSDELYVNKSTNHREDKKVDEAYIIFKPDKDEIIYENTYAE